MKSLERLQVRVACVAADAEYLLAVDLPDGATVGDALQASRIEERVSDLCGVPVYAIFGRRVTVDTRLVDGDRVEITRPLRCDPKALRRQRAAQRRQNPVFGDTEPTGAGR